MIEKDLGRMANPRFVEEMIVLADAGQWEEFDKGVLSVCNDSNNISWAVKSGLANSNENIRDLAISIFEQTSLKVLTSDQMSKIIERFERESNLHLRRKLAFVLFKYDHKEKNVIDCIQDAIKNDPELSEKARSLLTQK